MIGHNEAEPMNIYDAKGPFGDQRFYPFGKHPATLRLREELKMVENLPRFEQKSEMLEYIWLQLYRFEAGEIEAKIRWLEHSLARSKQAVSHD